MPEDKFTIAGEGQDSDLAKQVIASIKLHQKLFGLTDWYGKVTFKVVDEEDGGDCMETSCWPQYKKFEIGVDLKAISGGPEYINHYVRHELVHVVLWTFFGIAQDLCYKRSGKALIKLEEATVGMFENMPLWDVVYKALENDDSKM